jgi:hypothetical protein
MELFINAKFLQNKIITVIALKSYTAYLAVLGQILAKNWIVHSIIYKALL